MIAIDVSKLLEIGSEWAKDEMHRVYFNDLELLYGIRVERYHTGSVRSAWVDGEMITNTDARKILSGLSGKLYYDFATGAIESRGIKPELLPKLVAAIESKCAAESEKS